MSTCFFMDCSSEKKIMEASPCLTQLIYICSNVIMSTGIKTPSPQNHFSHM
jgi:hypothetical protein